MNEDFAEACVSCLRPLVAAVSGGNTYAPKPMTGTMRIEQQEPYLDTESLYALALNYLHGTDGMPKDEKQAEYGFRSAAFRGHLDSMYRLAEMYLKKPGHKSEARRWFEAAANEGHEPSLRRLEMEDWSKEEVVIPEQKPFAPEPPKGEKKENDFDVYGALSNIVSISAMSGLTGAAGSGFIVDGGYVVTNAHVITFGDYPKLKLANTIAAKFEPSIDNKNYMLNPIAVLPEFDLAILEFVGIQKDRIRNRKSNFSFRLDEIKLGEKVYTVGNPLNIGLSMSTGIVSRLDNDFRTTGYGCEVRNIIQTDMSINHGNSGGALLDRENKVIAVMSSMPSRAQGGISFGIKAEYVVALINEIKKQINKQQ